MKPLFMFIAALLISNTSHAYVVDCGHPRAMQQNIAGEFELAENSYKLDFNQDGRVYLITTRANDLVTQKPMQISFIDLKHNAYFTGNATAVHHDGRVWLNVQEIYTKPPFQAECK